MKNSIYTDLTMMADDGYCDASDFRSNQVNLVVNSEENFFQISIILDALGFCINRSKCLDELFSSVSEDPEGTGIVIIFVDQSISGRLESHFRLLKMMDYCLPVLIFNGESSTGSNAHIQKIYRDCVHDFTCATSILSKQIYSAIHASLAWASEIDSMHASSIKFLEKGSRKNGKN